jgi:tetratricopeptide (TPR) repeat protein
MNRLSGLFTSSIRLIAADTGSAGRKLLILVFILFASSVASARTQAQELGERKQHAQASLAAGQFTEAIAEYQEWLELQPKSVVAALGLAQSYRGVHNYDEARRVLGQAIRENPGNAEPLASLGDLEIELQSYYEAIHHLSAALSLRPDDLEARNRLALAYKAKGDTADALAQIAKVLARDPKNALAYYTRAQIESDQNHDAQALLDAEKVVALQPKNALGSILMAKILLRDRPGATAADVTKKCSQAVQLLEPLFPAHAGDSGTLYLLSRAYDCAGQPEKAKQTLAEFETASRNDRTTKENQTQAKHLVEQANALAQKNDFPGALDLLQQALAKDPKYGPANSQLAKIYYSEGDFEKADDAIGQALQSDPYQPDFLYVQGKILEKEGNPDQALAAFQQTTLVNPKESDAYFEMGVIYQQKSDREHALAAYKKAIELSPDDLDYKRALAGIQ